MFLYAILEMDFDGVYPGVRYHAARMQRYECDKCGACCKGTLIVEADDLDVLREPRLINADRHHRGKSVEKMVSE